MAARGSEFAFVPSSGGTLLVYLRAGGSWSWLGSVWKSDTDQRWGARARNRDGTTAFAPTQQEAAEALEKIWREGARK